MTWIPITVAVGVGVIAIFIWRRLHAPLKTRRLMAADALMPSRGEPVGHIDLSEVIRRKKTRKM